MSNQFNMWITFIVLAGLAFFPAMLVIGCIRRIQKWRKP